MQQCPNCSGELVFDIATQKLKCGFCGGLFDPASMSGMGAAEEQHYTTQDTSYLRPDGADQAVDVQPQSAFAQTNPLLQPGSAFAAQNPLLQPESPYAQQNPLLQPQSAPVQINPLLQPQSAPVQQSTLLQPQSAPVQPNPLVQPITASPAAAAIPAAAVVPPAAAYGQTQENGMPQQAAETVQILQGAEQFQTGAAQFDTAGAFAPQPEEVFFDVIEYTCPQCGGSIYSTEDSVNGFCNYCGAQHMLSSRMSRMRQPKYVIPFAISKGQCKEAYASFVKKALFVPGELKNADHLEQFRGIYMPYWLYDVNFNGALNLMGERSYRRGDYIFTEHYSCSCYVDSFFGGVSYDASANFDDYFSKGIAPFSVRALADFTPSYLSGFYADMQDVDCSVYTDTAKEFARDRIFNEIEKRGYFSTVKLKPESKNLIHPSLSTRNGTGTELAFFPVWFLAYRNKDRVAYAVVNGQNGNIVADMPVDNKKFLLISLLLAFPIYALLLLLPAMTPKVLMSLSLIIAFICMLLLNSTVSQVKRRDERTDDLGFQSKKSRLAFAEAKSKMKKSGGGSGKPADKKALFSIVYIIGGVGIYVIPHMLEAVKVHYVGLAVGACTVIAVLYGLNNAKGANGGFMLLASYILTAAVSMAGAFIILLNPSDDMVYYIGVVALMAVIVMGQLFALKEYNLLTTRPLPQLNRRGGDDSAPGM